MSTARDRMQHRLSFEDGVATVTTSGEATPGGWARFLAELRAHPDYDPGMPVLVDHGGLSLAGLRSPQAREIAEEVSKCLRLAEDTSRVAVVAPTDLTFGVSRMTQTYADPDLERTKVFRSRQEAERWLRTADRS